VRREHHRDRRAAGRGDGAGEATFGPRAAKVVESFAVERSEHLGLGVAEAHVVLEQLRALRRQHHAGVEDTAKVDVSNF
jgi:hypothetical protein